MNPFACGLVSVPLTHKHNCIIMKSRSLRKSDLSRQFPYERSLPIIGVCARLATAVPIKDVCNFSVEIPRHAI